MRTFLAFAAIFLVASTAYCASDDTVDKLTRIANSKFGKTILETVQVELQTKEDARPVIVRLLEELINETQTAQKNHDKRIATLRKDETANQKHYKAEISRLEDAIKADEADLADKIKELGKEKKASQAKQDEIDELQRQLDLAKAQREKEHAAFLKKDAKYDKLLDVLAHVRTIISNRLSMRSKSVGSSFLEKKANSQLINALAEIKETVNSESFAQVSQGYSTMISFIASKAQALLTPEQADANAEAGLTSVVAVIDRLMTKFRNEKTEAIRVEKERQREYEKKREELSDKQANARIEKAEIDRHISILEGQIANLKERIASNKASLKDYKEKLEASIKRLEEAEAEYARLTKQRTEELKILNEVLDIVNTRLTNLRANVEQAMIKAKVE